MGCECGCVSALLSQEVGGAYYYVRLVADNIQLLQDLAAQLDAKGDVIDILRGTTSIIAAGVVTSDPDNSHIAVTPEAGNADIITTIDGDPDGRVIVLVPASEAYTLTIEPQVQKPITATDTAINTFTVVGHGLATGELIGMSGPGLPADIAEGAYYAIVTGPDTFKLATSKANALTDVSVDLVNDGTGFLDIGNIKIDAAMTLTARQSAMFVKDGSTYTLLGTSSVLPALEALLSDKQPLNDLLTNISNLVLAGKAGKFIEINATEDGFNVLDYGLTDIQADLAGKSPLAHDHPIADVTGLQAALDGKQPLDSDLTAIAALKTTPFGRGLLELADLAALQALVGVDNSAPAPGAVPADADSISLTSWSDAMNLSTRAISGADSYRWRFYLADGVTLKREITTVGRTVSYTATQAASDGISRSYKVEVAGVNSNGAGGAFMSPIFNHAAPAAPTGVAFADGDYSSIVTFTEASGSNVAGYSIAYSTIAGFNPMTQGSMFSAGVSPAYTPQLAAGTWYGKIASYDLWSKQPNLLNFSAEDAFLINIGTGGATGGGGGGGFSGGGCPSSESFVETKNGWVLAKDVQVGDRVRVLTDDLLGLTWAEVESNQPKEGFCYTIESEGGYKLTVSDRTPITLQDGSSIFVWHINGHELPVIRNGELYWEPCHIIEAGVRPIAHITCHDKTFNAGDVAGEGIATHNLSTVKN